MGGGAEPRPRVSPSARADHVRVRSMRSTGTCSRVKCSQRGDGLEKILRVTKLVEKSIVWLADGGRRRKRGAYLDGSSRPGCNEGSTDGGVRILARV